MVMAVTWQSAGALEKPPGALLQTLITAWLVSLGRRNDVL